MLGMGDPWGSALASRRDFPGGSLHAAETDEGSSETRFYAVLHLFHLADPEMGARAISQRADGLSGARLLSAEFLRQYARHPALSSAERRDLYVQIPCHACRDAIEYLSHLQRFSTP